MLIKLNLSLFFLVAYLFQINATHNLIILNGQPTVTTQYGVIEGFNETLEHRTVHTFRGVPYAVPPVGELRFKPPQPVEPWNSSTLYAKNWPAQCPQRARQKWTDSDISFQPLVNSEDCLYLNVWVPTCASDRICDQKLPVFLFIHGGSFISLSSSSSKLFDGKALAVLGKVIVVTINYRLGLLGFLYANSTEAPGNQGLLDQELALKWVRENIQNFGGDVSEVTVSGESAGSISAVIHYMKQVQDVPQGSKPWINRWIFQSGIAIRGLYEPREASLLRFNAVSSIVGCDITKNSTIEETMACLRSASLDSILDTQEAITFAMQSFSPSPMNIGPTVGIEPLKEDVLDALANAKTFPKNQVLFTEMQNEGTVFLSLLLNGPLNGSLEDYQRLIRGNSNFFGIKDPEIMDHLISVYYSKWMDGNKSWLEYSLIRMIGDRFFNCPRLFFGQDLVDRGVKVHQAVFSFCDRDSSTPPEFFNSCKFGSQHGGDMRFVFGIPLIRGSQATLLERIFSRKIVEMWSNYVYNGELPWPESQKIRDDLSADYEYTLDIGPTKDFYPMRTSDKEWICQVWRPYIWPNSNSGSERGQSKCERRKSGVLTPEEKFDIYDYSE